MKLNGLLVPASLHAALVGGSAVLAPAEKAALCALVGAPPDDPWVALCGEGWIERENAAWADPETANAYRGSPVDIDGPGDVDHRRAILIGFAGSDSPIVLDFRTEPPCAHAVTPTRPPGFSTRTISRTAWSYASRWERTRLAMTASHRPSVRKVRLLRPPIARFTTSIAAGSKCATNGSPQPFWPAVWLRTVESPMMWSVGFDQAAAVRRQTRRKRRSGCMGVGGELRVVSGEYSHDTQGIGGVVRYELGIAFTVWRR